MKSAVTPYDLTHSPDHVCWVVDAAVGEGGATIDRLHRNEGLSADGTLPSAGRVLLAVQGVPAAIGLVVPGLLELSSVGMQRLDGSIVTSLVDGDPTQLVLQMNAIGSVALLVFAGTALLLLVLRIGLSGPEPAAQRGPGATRVPSVNCH